MDRRNILNGKYFINFRIIETTSNIIREPAEEGRIAGEAADGWFYVEILSGSAIKAREIWSVERLASARFYDGEYEFRDARSAKMNFGKEGR